MSRLLRRGAVAAIAAAAAIAADAGIAEIAAVDVDVAVAAARPAIRVSERASSAAGPTCGHHLSQWSRRTSHERGAGVRTYWSRRVCSARGLSGIRALS